MTTHLRVLLLEDSEDDAALILRALRRGGYEPEYRRAQSEEGMLAALDENEWDLIISDHAMPSFSATAGLQILRDRQLDLPFIIVSGAIGEETAAEAMAAGAGDYVMKDSLRRLVPAIERELREAATRATQRKAERALQESEERLRAVMDNVVDAILTVDGSGAIEGANPAAARLFGCRAPEDLAGRWFTELLSGPHADEYEAHFAVFGSRGSLPIAGVTREVLGRRADGAVFAMDLALSEMRLGNDRILIAVLRDISERKKAESQLRHLAEHDPLTGLANRRRFEEELTRQIAISRRSGESAAVLVLDLDNFKYVNDSLGHKAGDELIRRVAGVIGARVRETDTLARIGGDEFAVLLRGTDVAGARIAAEGILEAIRREPFLLEGQRIRATTSVGMALIEREPLAAGELLARADQAMYGAKDAGRDRLGEYSIADRAEIEAGRTWADRVRESLEQDRFLLHCQPIVDLRTGHTSQYELLLRMREEDGGLAMPGAFLSTAERFGLIQRIDRWVVREAIALVDSQRRQGSDVLVEVNLSGKSMEDPELPRLVEAELEATGIDPSRLIFEVTETMAIANLDKARELAEGLTRLGCRFALDDFGVGFASFYYLKHLPISFLKIDGDFIRDLPRSRTDQLVVRALVEISRGLGIRTVGECVEDEEALGLIREYGVDFAQGWATGRPGPPERVIGLAPLRGPALTG